MKKEHYPFLEEEFGRAVKKDSKRKERIENIIIAIITIALMLGVLAGIRIDSISYSNDDICQNEYGENYIYEYDNDFGKYCIELVYKNLTKINAKPFNWTSKEMNEICNTPRFFELDRWSSGDC